MQVHLCIQLLLEKRKVSLVLNCQDTEIALLEESLDGIGHSCILQGAFDNGRSVDVLVKKVLVVLNPFPGLESVS